jgi:hypothetical protein
LTSPTEPTLLSCFFEGAARYYRASPWRTLSDGIALRLDFAQLDYPLFAVVMGAAAETYGLALYFSGERLLEIYDAQAPDLGADAIAVVFEREIEVPASWKKMRRGLDFPLAGPAAFPLPLRHYAHGESGWPDPAELATLAAALEAVAAFVEAHRDRLAAGAACDDVFTVPVTTGEAVVHVSFPARIADKHDA